MATNPSAPISPLRQRMLYEMMMRGLSRRTRPQYVRNIQRFAAFPERPPDTATAEDLRNCQIHQHERGANAGTINNTVSVRRFLHGDAQAAGPGAWPRRCAPSAHGARGTERRGGAPAPSAP